jgi:hypothetical protein
MERLRRHTSTAAVVVAFTALVISLTANAGAFTGTAARAPAKPTVIVVKATGSNIAPGEGGGKQAKCPSGYSVFSGAYVISGSQRAIPFVVGPVRKDNAYEVDVSNPPADPLAGLPGEDAQLLVAAMCARTGTPIVMPKYG